MKLHCVHLIAGGEKVPEGQGGLLCYSHGVTKSQT